MPPKIKITIPDQKPFSKKSTESKKLTEHEKLIWKKFIFFILEIFAISIAYIQMVGRVPFNFIKTTIEILKVYFREFWYIRSGIKFEPSSKKFWAQWAHIAFFVALYARVFGPDTISARISDSLLGILAGHAVAAMGWYAVGKQKDINNSIKNNITGNVIPGTIKTSPEQEAQALEIFKK
jgi:hypothetical protein